MRTTGWILLVGTIVGLTINGLAHVDIEREHATQRFTHAVYQTRAEREYHDNLARTRSGYIILGAVGVGAILILTVARRAPVRVAEAGKVSAANKASEIPPSLPPAPPPTQDIDPSERLRVLEAQHRARSYKYRYSRYD